MILVLCIFMFRIIKESVMKMDSSIINKEGIEKLLTMLPSEEEISRIEEAQGHIQTIRVFN